MAAVRIHALEESAHSASRMRAVLRERFDTERQSSRWSVTPVTSGWKVPLTEDRSFALLIRAWFEDGPETFRARVTALCSRSEHGEVSRDLTVAVAISPREVMSAVSDWLDALVRQGQNPIDGD